MMINRAFASSSYNGNMYSLLKELSAWVPIAMSLAVFTMLIGFFFIQGVVHETDEGVGAHIFQFLMAGQLPVIAFFAFKWLPQRPTDALQVLALQIGAAVIAAAPVFIFQL